MIPNKKNRVVEEGSEETMDDTESQRQSTLSDEAYKQVIFDLTNDTSRSPVLSLVDRFFFSPQLFSVPCHGRSWSVSALKAFPLFAVYSYVCLLPQVTSLLDLIRNRISQSPEAAALFYDELARIIQLGGIDPKIEVNFTSHSYHICCVELLPKVVCKTPFRKVSAMQCW